MLGKHFLTEALSSSSLLFLALGSLELTLRASASPVARAKGFCRTLQDTTPPGSLFWLLSHATSSFLPASSIPSRRHPDQNPMVLLTASFALCIIVLFFEMGIT